MKSPISGVLYHGRFYSDENPLSRSISTKHNYTPFKYTDLQKYYEERDQERKYVQQMHKMKTKKFNKKCTGCQLLQTQKPCLHMNCLKADLPSSDTDEILEDSPFRNQIKKHFEIIHKKDNQSRNAVNPLSLPKNSCIHCHRIAHLCTCQCNCTWCARNRVCSCIDCVLQRRKSMLEALDEKIEEFHYKEIRDLRARSETEQQIYEERRQQEIISDLKIERVKLQSQLIACQTREEACRIKYRLQLNEQLIRDCEELLANTRRAVTRQNQTDNITQSQGINTSQGENWKVRTKAPTGTYTFQSQSIRDQDLDSPPLPIPDQHPLDRCYLDSSASDPIKYANQNEYYQSCLVVNKNLFGKRARQDFEQTGNVQKIIAPSYFNSQERTQQYLGDFVEPELFIGKEHISPANHQKVFERLRGFVSKYTLSTFEKNCFWAFICYIGRLLTPDLVQTLNKTYNVNTYDYLIFNYKIQQLYICLPCQRNANPPHALMSSKFNLSAQQIATDVANVGIPYFGKQPLLPKALRIEKVGRFDQIIYFDSARLCSAVEQAVYYLTKYMQGVI